MNCFEHASRCTYSKIKAEEIAYKITSTYGNEVVFCSISNIPGPSNGTVRAVVLPTPSQIISSENPAEVCLSIAGRNVILQDVRRFYKDICDASFPACTLLFNDPLSTYVGQEEIFTTLRDLFYTCEQSSSWCDALKTSLEDFSRSGKKETKAYADFLYEEYFVLNIPFETALYNTMRMLYNGKPLFASSSPVSQAFPMRTDAKNELEAAAKILMCRRDFERGLRLDFARILLSRTKPYDNEGFE